MRIKIGNGLLPLNLLVILLAIAIIFFPSNVLRIILGFPFVLFFPGYALMAAFYPKREGVSGIERVALSLGLSIAIVAAIGLILNYTWGIRLNSILYSILTFIFITSVIAWLRRRGLPEEERFSIEFRLTLPGQGESIWNKTLSIILVFTILGALGMMSYAIVAPKVGEKFTEFYIVEYPKELAVGEEGRAIVGIANHEYRTVDYQIEVRINEARQNEVGSIVLKHDEVWEDSISFVLEVAGEKQKVEFLLYKDGETESSFEPLRLWVNVIE